MTMIANYYAQVGVRIQKDALQKIDRHLSSVRSRLTAFQKSIGELGNVRVGATLDTQRSLTAIRQDITRIGKDLRVDIERFGISRSNLLSQLQQTIKESRPLQIDAKISPRSTIKMTKQLQTAVNKTQSNLNLKGGVRLVASLRYMESLNRIQADLNRIGQAAILRLANVQVGREKFLTDLQNDLKASKGIFLTAKLSTQSLEQMKLQVVEAFRDLAITPRINARNIRGDFGSERNRAKTSGTGRLWWGGDTQYATHKTTRMSPISGRRFNPWYNPMMIGGSAGAFLRYGIYSLPLMAGSMGVISLAQRAEEAENAMRLMQVATGSKERAQEEMDFLDRIGSEIGFIGREVAPQYARLLMSARGTSLEGGMRDYFDSLMSYSAVMQANPETINNIFREIFSTGVITKGTLNQLSSAGFADIFQLMADAVSGGDIDKLLEKMKGQGLPVETALPQLFAMMRKESNKFIVDHYNTLERNRARSKQASEKWWQALLGKDFSAAISDFYRISAEISENSLPFAEVFGKILAGIVRTFNLGILSLREFWDYLIMEPGEDNFFVRMFGDPENNELIKTINSMYDSIKGLVDGTKLLWDEYGEYVLATFGVIADGAYELATATAKTGNVLLEDLEVILASLSHGVSGADWVKARQMHRKEGTEEEFLAQYPSPKEWQDGGDFVSPFAQAMQSLDGYNFFTKGLLGFNEIITNLLGYTYLEKGEDGKYRFSGKLLPTAMDGWWKSANNIPGIMVQSADFISNRALGIAKQLNSLSDYLFGISYPEQVFDQHKNFFEGWLDNLFGVSSTVAVASMEEAARSVAASVIENTTIPVNAVVEGTIRVEGDLIESSEVNAAVLEAIEDAINSAATRRSSSYPRNNFQ